MKISFNQSGRTGNLLFQYTACKLITLLYGHQYIPLQHLHNIKNEETITIDENSFEIIFIEPFHKFNSVYFIPNYKKNIDIKNKNIILDGYFQKSKFFVPYRKQLINMILNDNNNDYWIRDNINYYVKDILYSSKHSITNLSKNDIVVSLRLDDFIQLPSQKSDILPPQYYLNIIDILLSEFCKKNRLIEQNLEKDQNYVSHKSKVYIVCDVIRYDWEVRYLKFFNKYNPILIQNTLIHDIALMRDANILIHSNSTLCWLSSFFSILPEKRRFIPKTFHYINQNLNEINPLMDNIFLVETLKHAEVFDINHEEYNKTFIHSLPYSIPDECIITEKEHDEILQENAKVNFISDIIPSHECKYRFQYNEEKEYNEQYKKSWFAHTMKKGGWDCLRHYEIMSNGCIPIFLNLEDCPHHTLTSFPKKLALEIKELFYNIHKSSGGFTEDNIKYHSLSVEEQNKIKEYSKLITNHTREHCSTSATSKYFIETLESHINNNLAKFYLEPPIFLNFSQKRNKNILLIRTDSGVNYTREFLWIGLKKYFSNIENNETQSIFVEYPKIDYLYKSFPEENKKHIYGNGFTYSRKIDDDITINEEQIIEKTREGFWDLVIFGKVGPDEGILGTLPHMPLWELIFNVYTKEQIIFLYGGDECISLKYDNKYKDHILKHSQYGHCFVREFDI